MTPSASKIEVIVHFANGGRLTPDDFALIEAIRVHRSIIGAGRATGVSYRKCWLMVDALNRTFEAPVFATYPGRKDTGSELTPFGARLVALYKSMERRSRSGAAAAMAELAGALNPGYRPRASGGALEEPKSATRRPRSRQS